MTSHRGRIRLERTRQIPRKELWERKKQIPERLRDGPHLLRSVPCRKCDHGRDLKQTNLERICRADLHTEGVQSATQGTCRSQARTNLRAMFPCRANEIAFMNSVVFGTRANKVIPRNFSSIPDPSSTTSTTPTSNSTQNDP